MSVEYKICAIVTGAAGLLGRQHCLALLDDGWFVVVTDADVIKLESFKKDLTVSGYSNQFATFEMDVTDECSILQVADELRKLNLVVGTLVNNAAIDPKVGVGAILDVSAPEEMSVERWNLEVMVGLTGAFLCSRVFGAQMAARGSGVILNVASDLSVIAPDQRLYMGEDGTLDNTKVKPATYSVIKHGLVGMTKYFASYWAHRGVRCNSLSPGGVFAGQDALFVSRICERIPMGRMAEEDELRGVVRFLCSDDSKYMTGQNIVMDGGRSVI